MPTQSKYDREIATIKADVAAIGHLFSKLDDAIDKIGNASANISAILAVHDERIDNAEKMVTERRKEASEAVAEQIQATLAEASSFMSAPPVIYEGEAVYGKMYQTIAVGETKPSYMRLVVGVAKDTDAVLNFLKEKVEPIYEESDGLQLTGAIFDGNSAISWNFWDSQEDMDAAVEKLQAALDSESETELFDGSTVAYMGPVYAFTSSIDFNEGETPN